MNANYLSFVYESVISSILPCLACPDNTFPYLISTIISLCTNVPAESHCRTTVPSEMGKESQVVKRILLLTNLSSQERQTTGGRPAG